MRAFIPMAGAAVAASLFGAIPAMAGDPAAGERVFLQCRTCHQIGPNARNAVGPHLNGLFGRKKGTVPGYAYSNAYKALTDQEWTVENFTVYIKDPRGVTPGTKMVFAGLRDETQIQNLIAYLQQFGPDGQRK